nr:hypothetical protein [Candidatus Dojkabacteria bacterium]
TQGGPQTVLDSSFAEFIEPENQEKWNEMIGKCIYEKDLYKNKSSIGKEYVEKYRWKNIIPAIEETYFS